MISLSLSKLTFSLILLKYVGMHGDIASLMVVVHKLFLYGLVHTWWSFIISPIELQVLTNLAHLRYESVEKKTVQILKLKLKLLKLLNDKT